MLAERTYVEKPTAPDPNEIYRQRQARLAGVGRFVRFVAEGGMGAVLEVRGDGLGVGEGRDRFALKLIKESLVGDPQAVERFRRELQSHRRFSEQFQVPRLVPCLDFHDDEAPRQVFGLFPLYGEGTLEDLLLRRLPIAEALAILADAVEGLQSLHGLSYVHRDFHPSNILVEIEGGRRRGVLGDLGVGMFLESNTIFTDTQLDADRGRKVGHRGFMDPYGQASPAADLFSVGATLYRILSGETPGGTRYPTPGPLGLPDARGRVFDARTRRLADDVLAGLTAPAVADRYPNLRPVRADVARLIERIGPETRAVTAQTKDSRAALRRASRRRRRLLPAALVVAATFLGGYGVWEWHGESPSFSRESPPSSPVQGGPFSRGGEPEPPPVPRESPSSSPFSKGGEPEPPPAREDLPGRGSLPPFEKGGIEGGFPKVTPVPARRIQEADALIRGRELRRAEELLTLLLKEHPGDPEVTGRLARTLPFNHRAAGLRRAHDVLADALDRHPDAGDLRLALARVLMQLKRPGDALQLLREAPPTSSHQDEITALEVTLGGDRDLP